MTGPRRVAWFHCFAGIAGDMALGSLLDAGADLDGVVEILQRLPIGRWSLRTEPTLRNGIAATQAIVSANDDSVVRTYAHIRGLLEEARLPERISDRALAAFAALAEVEAQIHRRAVEQVHFHEVGGHDAIIDIVGTATALELLGIDEVRASPVAVGSGMVRTAHGLLPNPAPAVVALLAGAETVGRPYSVELTTPTGAALLATLATSYGPLPAMRVEAVGYGAGSRELDDLPNCCQVVLGTSAAAGGERGPAGDPARAAGDGSGTAGGQPAVLLETNVDDVSGETLAHCIAVLLDSGASDAWLTPVQMKKGRPGSVVSVLCDAALAQSLRAIVEQETGSLGVRAREVTRFLARRSLEEVEVDGLPVRVKVSPGRVKAEYDDAAIVARRTARPLREVVARAEATWQAQHRAPGGRGPDDRGGGGRNGRNRNGRNGRGLDGG
jgi:uncharacterized protein (TIGR00299 family) protein